MKGKRLCVKNNGRGGIGSLRFGNIAETNEHVAVQVGELVFDNLYPDGIPLSEWIEDIGIDELDQLDLREEALGSRGCL